MPQPQLSVQLYSLRGALDQDLDGSLARLAGMGFRAVEAFDFVRRPAELAAAFRRHGLAAPSGHAPLASDTLQDKPAPPWDEVFAAATEIGAQYVIDPMVGPERWSHRDAVRETADKLNAAAAAAAAHGLQVGYHNHSQEFHHDIEGRSAFEFFVDQLVDEVIIELDVYWATVAGQDVPALMRRLGSRLKTIHVKDGAVATDPFRTGDFDALALGQVPAGEGDVALDEILAAAGTVEHAIVEFDAYDGDIFAGIAGSQAYLAERGIA